MEQVRKHHIDIHTTENQIDTISQRWKVSSVSYGKTGSASCSESMYPGGFGTMA